MFLIILLHSVSHGVFKNLLKGLVRKLIYHRHFLLFSGHRFKSLNLLALFDKLHNFGINYFALLLILFLINISLKPILLYVY